MLISRFIPDGSLPIPYENLAHDHGIGHLLVFAVIWSAVRRVVNLLPLPVVLLVVGLAVTYALVRWLKNPRRVRASR